MIDDNGLAIPESDANDECNHAFEPFRQGFVMCVKCHQVREIERSAVSSAASPTQGADAQTFVSKWRDVIKTMPDTYAQGADARPVAIYQIEQHNGSWLDVSLDAYESTEVDRRRIVCDARGTVPSDGLSSPPVIDQLDFEPDEQHAIADMANVGYAFMEQIECAMPGYSWCDSPAEIICDLINERDEFERDAALWRKAKEIGYLAKSDEDTLVKLIAAIAPRNET